MSKNWHPQHFCCTECHEPLGNGIIEEKDGKPYCHKDYQRLFGIKCSKCNEPILSGGYITALEKPWHVDCFVCNVRILNTMIINKYIIIKKKKKYRNETIIIMFFFFFLFLFFIFFFINFTIPIY